MEFIPRVEVLNNPDAFGTEGAGEFDMMANQIIAHDEMVKNIRANLSFFGNPTLLSSRPKQDIVEHDASDPARVRAFRVSPGSNRVLPVARPSSRTT